MTRRCEHEHSRIEPGPRSRRSGTASTRPGIALLVVLLALLTVEVAVVATLYIATQERLTGRAAVQRERARLAAESGITVALSGWDPVRAASLPLLAPAAVAAATAPGGGVIDVHLERVAGSAFRVVATGSIAGAVGIEAKAGALAYIAALLPHDVAADFPAPLLALGDVRLGAGGYVEGGSGAALAACPPPADSLMATSLQVPAPGLLLRPAATLTTSTGGSISGTPPVVRTVAGTDTAAIRSLAGADVASIMAMADRSEFGAVAPAPAAVGGVCDLAAPANWGAPGGGHPCHGYAPLIHAPGDLAMTAGTGQGVLIVSGSLYIDAAASFAGAVIVLGDADVRGTIHGALRVAGDVSIDGHVRHDPCALWNAVVRSPTLGRPFRPQRWRIVVP